jgi:hypothetical protein
LKACEYTALTWRISREVCLAGVKDEMVVVDHQAVRHDGPVESVHGLGKQFQKALPISVVDKITCRRSPREVT